MAIRGGIDLGGTKIQAIVFDTEAAKVLGQSRRPTPLQGGPPDVADELVASLQDAAAEADLTSEQLAGVGVGSPGEIDAATGTVSHASNLPNWEEPYGLGSVLSERLGTSVLLGNDVDVATRAEFELGAGRDANSLLGVFWGTGVGGGLVLDGKPWIGRGSAGEIGHMVIKRNGARCLCGRRGCMEAYAGRRAMELRAHKKVTKGAETKLFSIMERKGKPNLTSSVWETALAKDDKLARQLLERALRALGAGIASAVNLLDVELVIIGGGLGVRFGEPMAQRIAAAMQPHLFFDERPPEVHVAALGDLGGAIGAALLSEREVPVVGSA